MPIRIKTNAGWVCSGSGLEPSAHPSFPISPVRGEAQQFMPNFRFNPPKHSDNNITDGVMPAHAMEDSI